MRPIIPGLPIFRKCSSQHYVQQEKKCESGHTVSIFAAFFIAPALGKTCASSAGTVSVTTLSSAPDASPVPPVLLMSPTQRTADSSPVLPLLVMSPHQIPYILAHLKTFRAPHHCLAGFHLSAVGAAHIQTLQGFHLSAVPVGTARTQALQKFLLSTVRAAHAQPPRGLHLHL